MSLGIMGNKRNFRQGARLGVGSSQAGVRPSTAKADKNMTLGYTQAQWTRVCAGYSIIVHTP